VVLGGASLSDESMRLLLEAGADPNVRQQSGFTPLHAAAAQLGTLEIARILLAHGAARIAADAGNDQIAALL
jgi:ankyrin repeat protein